MLLFSLAAFDCMNSLILLAVHSCKNQHRPQHSRPPLDAPVNPSIEPTFIILTFPLHAAAIKVDPAQERETLSSQCEQRTESACSLLYSFVNVLTRLKIIKAIGNILDNRSNITLLNIKCSI